jgi:hypothetical protein
MDAVLEKDVTGAGIPCHPWSQLDPRWGDDLLGLATDRRYTLAAYGCLLTCFATATEMNPAELNEWLKQRKAFVDNGEGQFNLIILDSFAPLGFRLAKDVWCLKLTAPVADASQCLASGGLIIVGVSHLGITDKVQHYIRITKLSADGDTVEIIDPLRNPGDEVVSGVAQYGNKWGNDPAHVFLRVLFYEAVK